MTFIGWMAVSVAVMVAMYTGYEIGHLRATLELSNMLMDEAAEGLQRAEDDFERLKWGPGLGLEEESDDGQ